MMKTFPLNYPVFFELAINNHSKLLKNRIGNILIPKIEKEKENEIGDSISEAQISRWKSGVSDIPSTRVTDFDSWSESKYISNIISLHLDNPEMIGQCLCWMLSENLFDITYELKAQMDIEIEQATSSYAVIAVFYKHAVLDGKSKKLDVAEKETLALYYTLATSEAVNNTNDVVNVRHIESIPFIQLGYLYMVKKDKDSFSIQDLIDYARELSIVSDYYYDQLHSLNHETIEQYFLHFLYTSLTKESHPLKPELLLLTDPSNKNNKKYSLFPSSSNQLDKLNKDKLPIKSMIPLTPLECRKEVTKSILGISLANLKREFKDAYIIYLYAFLYSQDNKSKSNKPTLFSVQDIIDFSNKEIIILDDYYSDIPFLKYNKIEDCLKYLTDHLFLKKDSESSDTNNNKYSLRIDMDSIPLSNVDSKDYVYRAIQASRIENLFDQSPDMSFILFLMILYILSSIDYCTVQKVVDFSRKEMFASDEDYDSIPYLQYNEIERRIKYLVDHSFLKMDPDPSNTDNHQYSLRLSKDSLPVSDKDIRKFLESYFHISDGHIRNYLYAIIQISLTIIKNNINLKRNWRTKRMLKKVATRRFPLKQYSNVKLTAFYDVLHSFFDEKS